MLVAAMLVPTWVGAPVTRSIEYTLVGLSWNRNARASQVAKAGGVTWALAGAVYPSEIAARIANAEKRLRIEGGVLPSPRATDVSLHTLRIAVPFFLRPQS